jgi:hypothetical protein
MARRPATGWGHPAPGWGQAFPGWTPLDDPGALPFRAARSLARWWWPISAITSFLTVVGYVLTYDPQPGLSNRGWLTVVLAAVVVVLLSIHRAARGGPPRAPLARAVAEYAVVALLVMLLATAGVPQPTQAPQDAAGREPPTEQPADRQRPGQNHDPSPERATAGAADHRPGIVRVVTGVWGWLAELWHTAGELADRRSSPTSTTTPKEGT